MWFFPCHAVLFAVVWLLDTKRRKTEKLALATQQFYIMCTYLDHEFACIPLLVWVSRILLALEIAYYVREPMSVDKSKWHVGMWIICFNCVYPDMYDELAIVFMCAELGALLFPWEDKRLPYAFQLLLCLVFRASTPVTFAALAHECKAFHLVAIS